MADSQRAGRMAKRIQTIVAAALERQIKDPRVELITITDTRVTGDLHDATVYYTVRGHNLGDTPDHEGAADALQRARGQLRKLVGNELGVRFTPTLSFELDTMPESSAHLEQLLDRARRRDEELAQIREGKSPAGEADPYRHSEDEDAVVGETR